MFKLLGICAAFVSAQTQTMSRLNKYTKHTITDGDMTADYWIEMDQET